MFVLSTIGVVVDFLGITGNVAEKGTLGRCTNTEVYPTVVKSALKSLIEGVVLRAVEGVSRMLRKDPEVRRIEVMDGRRLREMEGLRELVTEGLRRGERGAGDPGWTCWAQEVMAETVLERRRGGEGGAPVGGEGNAWVGRFFWGGGWAKKA